MGEKENCELRKTTQLLTWCNIYSHFYAVGQYLLVFPAISPEHHNMPLAVDLLQPKISSEKRRHKLKRLVQHPNSFFMDVKCPGCYRVTTIFSHAHTVVICSGCSSVLCHPTGGRTKLTEGCAFRRKN